MLAFRSKPCSLNPVIAYLSFAVCLHTSFIRALYSHWHIFQLRAGHRRRCGQTAFWRGHGWKEYLHFYCFSLTGLHSATLWTDDDNTSLGFWMHSGRYLWYAYVNYSIISPTKYTCINIINMSIGFLSLLSGFLCCPADEMEAISSNQ